VSVLNVGKVNLENNDIHSKLPNDAFNLFLDNIISQKNQTLSSQDLYNIYYLGGSDTI
jgi:hypothetical protein